MCSSELHVVVPRSEGEGCLGCGCAALLVVAVLGVFDVFFSAPDPSDECWQATVITCIPHIEVQCRSHFSPNEVLTGRLADVDSGATDCADARIRRWKDDVEGSCGLCWRLPDSTLRVVMPRPRWSGPRVLRPAYNVGERLQDLRESRQ